MINKTMIQDIRIELINIISRNIGIIDSYFKEYDILNKEIKNINGFILDAHFKMDFIKFNAKDS